MSDQHAYFEGIDAYFTHADNPYPSGSQEFRDWEEGFDDAWVGDYEVEEYFDEGDE